MKYKIGDKPTIRKDLIAGTTYGVVFVEDMQPFMGQTVTITEVYPECFYSIKEDSGNWSWTDEMFEGGSESKVTVEFPEDNNVISAGNMGIGDIGEIVWSIVKEYEGLIVLRSYDSLIALDDPEKTWRNISDAKIKVKLFPKGTKITITI